MLLEDILVRTCSPMHFRYWRRAASRARRVADLPGLAILDAGLVQSLTSGSADSVDVYREAMDLCRFGSDTYLQLLRDHLRAKYAAKKIDAVIAAMGPALDFLLAYGDTVFPGTPIVFCGIDRREIERRALPGHTGAAMFDWRQLRRWRISESRLPAGSTIRYR